jgi:hypothetical protein
MCSTMKIQNKYNHKEEFMYIWKAFFFNDQDIPEKVLLHYESILLKINSSKFCTPLNIELLSIPNQYLEPLEYYLRFKKPQNQLTKKVHAISYLVEANRESYDKFFLERTSLLKCYTKMLLIPIEMLLKLVIGFVICKRYQVV